MYSIVPNDVVPNDVIPFVPFSDFNSMSCFLKISIQRKLIHVICLALSRYLFKGNFFGNVPYLLRETNYVPLLSVHTFEHPLSLLSWVISTCPKCILNPLIKCLRIANRYKFSNSSGNSEAMCIKILCPCI